MASVKRCHKHNVRIALAQMPVRFEEPQKNAERAEKFLERAADEGADLAALPECFVLPPLMYAEPIPGPLTERFSALARRLRLHVVLGSIGEKARGRVYNTACLLDDRGRLVGRYRKRFLWWSERPGTAAGREAPVFRTRLGRIGLALCWDLAFPEHFRDLALAGAQVIVCPAHWQAGDRFGRLAPRRLPRVKPLEHAEEFFIDTCVGARAAENGVAVAFVNAVGRTRSRVGPDRLVGLSQVAVPFEGVIAHAGSRSALLVADVDLGLVGDAERSYGLCEDARRTRRQSDSVRA
jgi:predicted amidohydrolase